LSGSGSGETFGDNIWDYTFISGQYRQLQTVTGGGCSGGSSACSDFWPPPYGTIAAWCSGQTGLTVGKCITPYAQMDAGCHIVDGGWCCRWSLNASYAEWKCAC
jgi:hypothetical protein